MRTANPALKDKTFAGARAAAGEPAMTLPGTATKSLLLLVLTVFSASFPWAVASAKSTSTIGHATPHTLGPTGPVDTQP